MSYLWVVGTVALAVLILSLERQREFPSSFSPVTVVLAKGQPVMGLYVGSNSNSVVIGQRRIDRAREIQAAARNPLAGELQPPRSEIRAAERCTADTRPCKVTPRLIVIERGEVRRLRLREADDILPEANSLFGRVIGDEVSCLLPECRFGDERRSVFALPLP